APPSVMTLIFLQPPSSSPSTTRPDPRCCAPSGGNTATPRQTPRSTAAAATGSYDKELLSCRELLLRHTHTHAHTHTQINTHTQALTA
ncbi:unnamed protein product, partial [Tetraodon nigroviridis]